MINDPICGSLETFRGPYLSLPLTSNFKTEMQIRKWHESRDTKTYSTPRKTLLSLNKYYAYKFSVRGNVRRIYPPPNCIAVLGTFRQWKQIVASDAEGRTARKEWRYKYKLYSKQIKLFPASLNYYARQKCPMTLRMRKLNMPLLWTDMCKFSVYALTQKKFIQLFIWIYEFWCI